MPDIVSFLIQLKELGFKRSRYRNNWVWTLIPENPEDKKMLAAALGIKLQSKNKSKKPEDKVLIQFNETDQSWQYCMNAICGYMSKREGIKIMKKLTARGVHAEKTEEKPLIITIDGPCGAGKTQTAKMLAKKLDIAYLDTGGMYRALAYVFIQENFDYEHSDPMERKAKAANIQAKKLRMRYEDGQLKFELNELDITPYIRKEEVSEAASKISVYPEIRTIINQTAKAFAANQSIVAEGRDTGTALFPNATLRYYLNPGITCRAHRRLKDPQSDIKDLQAALKLLQTRDNRDMTRANDPLPDEITASKKGLCVINNESMTLEQTVYFIYEQVMQELQK